MRPPQSVDEFIAWEAAQALRHEFHRGEVFPVARSRMGDSTVKLNIVAALRRVLQGTSCRVVENVLLRVCEDAAYYPDCFVVCGRAAAADNSLAEDAKVVVEVVSPSTAAFDRGEKGAMYLQMGGLAMYLMVDPDERTVVAFERERDGWVFCDFSRQSNFTIDALGPGRISLAEVFADLQG